jgi:hypothetical protein
MMLTATQLACAMPLSCEQVVEDFLFFRDQWSSHERSFTEESRAQMLEFVDGPLRARTELNILSPKSSGRGWPWRR